jgi:Mrp family chromosome partitioning ATPase/predicted Fe-Mo cluster-binding NifX family protein
MTEKHGEGCCDPECSEREKGCSCSEEKPKDGSPASRMSRIRRKLLVLSGKGGVGKSTVAVNLAAALAMAGKRVGLLDVDIHGPSVPKLLGVEGGQLTATGDDIDPLEVPCGPGALRVMSIGFLLRERDEPVIWRGPRKHGVIKQFLEEVEWGELDWLVVDAPPGTGDEPLAVAQLVGDASAVVVTTPQALAVQDVRRSVVFCREVKVPVLGVVENMSGFSCPRCGERVSIFGSDGGRAMAEQMGLPFLGAIPIEPEVVLSGDAGRPIVQSQPHSETAKAFGRIVRTLLAPELSAAAARPAPRPEAGMKIAVPVTGGSLSTHFGHCEQFALFDVANDGRTVVGREMLTPPPHEPGTFPKWLHEQGTTVVIAGGLGSRAQSLFAQETIQVVIGASGEPEAVVRAFLDGQLSTGANTCDH